MSGTEQNSLEHQLVASIRQMKQETVEETVEELHATEDAAATIERLNTELTCYSEALEALRHENEHLKATLHGTLERKPDGHPAVGGLIRSLYEASETRSTSHHGALFAEAASYIEGMLTSLEPIATPEGLPAAALLNPASEIDVGALPSKSGHREVARG